MTKLFESVKETTGVDLKEVMRAETYDAKVNKNVNVTGLPEAAVNVSVNGDGSK
jgi:flotillin